jgi:hypothetical protein
MRLRLRRVESSGSGTCEFKLTQKLPADRPGYIQGLITNTYLSAAEYDPLASLPGEVLRKTRLSVPPLGIDVFDPPLHGLVLSEAEFPPTRRHNPSPSPSCDRRGHGGHPINGGNLVRIRRRDLLAWLAEYRINSNR